jgi:hypothetical protein
LRRSILQQELKSIIHGQYAVAQSDIARSHTLDERLLQKREHLGLRYGMAEVLLVRHIAQLLHTTVCDFEDTEAGALHEMSARQTRLKKRPVIATYSAYLFDASLNHIQEPVVACLQNGAFKHRCIQDLLAVKTQKKRNEDERTSILAGG